MHDIDTIIPNWRAAGAKRRGSKGWGVRSPRRGPFWMIDAGPIDWPTETFWRVGLCDREHYVSDDRRVPVEVAHLRFPTEGEAFEAVLWLAACAAERVRRR